MTILNQKRLTLIVTIGLCYWFFGNLYEAIVFSPNWVVDSPAQMKRLNEFFVTTSPTLYFVPLTQIATLLVWFLLWKNDVDTIKKELRRTGIFAALVYGVECLHRFNRSGKTIWCRFRNVWPIPDHTDLALEYSKLF